MKKVKILKKLKADVETFKRLPIKNCQFTNISLKDNSWETPADFELIGLCKDLRPFVSSNGLPYEHCFEVIERNPREVPEGVQVLPPNKPYLAYIGTIEGDQLLKSQWVGTFVILGNQWELFNGAIPAAIYPTAIDVSTDWAKKHYPEFVEAMGYRPIYNPRDGSLKHHELDGKFYDLDWKLIQDEPTNGKSISNPEWNIIKDKPEPSKYKYETVQDLLLDMGYSITNSTLEKAALAVYEAIFQASRELKEGEE